MNEIWYNTKATDEEIANCHGDYIGCEICCNVDRCLDMMLKKLDKAIRKEEDALDEETKKQYYADLLMEQQEQM